MPVYSELGKGSQCTTTGKKSILPRLKALYVKHNPASILLTISRKVILCIIERNGDMREMRLSCV